MCITFKYYILRNRVTVEHKWKIVKEKVFLLQKQQQAVKSSSPLALAKYTQNLDDCIAASNKLTQF